jgi:hypothetical protein
MSGGDMGMGGANGNGQTKGGVARSGKRPRDVKRLAKIVFEGPIEDARGKQVRELYEDEANWELGAQLLNVELPAPQQPQRGLAIVGAAAEHPPEIIPVPVAGYEIRQPIGPDEFVFFFVPIAQVRCVRIPHEVVEVRDARGDVAQRVAMRCAAADRYREEREQRELAKGDATKH